MLDLLEAAKRVRSQSRSLRRRAVDRERRTYLDVDRIREMLTLLRRERGGLAAGRSTLTVEQVREVLATAAAEIEGGSRDDWRSIVGKVHHLPITSKVVSNWTLLPSGRPEQNAVIRKVAKALRQTYPYVHG